MLRRLIGENIDLAWHPGSNLPPVKVDPSQLNQVMANMVDFIVMKKSIPAQSPRAL